MKKIGFLLLSIYTLSLMACNTQKSEKHQDNDTTKASTKKQEKHAHKHAHGDANAYMNQSKFEELVVRFENPERLEWQKPQEVLKFLGEVKDKTIFDLGARTGYFSFLFAEKGAKVTAADIDERFLDFIKNKRDSLKIDEKTLNTRKIPTDSPQLKDQEADLVFVNNVYHHIEQREQYFAKVLQGLKEKGRLVIIDFKNEETPHGPPLEMRIAPAQIEKELKAAGFTKISINQTVLPYQFILVAE